MNGKSNETHAILKPLPIFLTTIFFFDSPIYIDRHARIVFRLIQYRYVPFSILLSSHENCHITLRPTITTNPVFPTRNPNNKSGGRREEKKNRVIENGPVSFNNPSPSSFNHLRPSTHSLLSPPSSPPSLRLTRKKHRGTKLGKIKPARTKKRKKRKTEKGKREKKQKRPKSRSKNRSYVKSRSGKERGENRGGRVASDVEHFFPGILLLAGSSNRPSTSARNDGGAAAIALRNTI